MCVYALLHQENRNNPIIYGKFGLLCSRLSSLQLRKASGPLRSLLIVIPLGQVQTRVQEVTVPPLSMSRQI